VGSVVLLAALMVGCSSWPTQVNASEKAVKDRRPAPDFTLTDAHGALIKLSDFKGKVVLLNFWARWCGPCKIEIPWFIEFEKMYRDRGFAVLGVSMDDDGWQAVKPFIEVHKVNYRIAIGNDQLAELYGGILSLPTTFIVDRDGRIAAVHVGLVSKSKYESEILRLLDGDEQTEARGPAVLPR
jgi:peroxiredoxin